MSLEKLKDWLRIRDNLVMYGQRNRTIITNRKINKGDIIMRIPNDKLIDNDKLDIDSSKYNVRSTNSLIAVYLINNENNPDLKPYYDIIPKNINNFFYFLDPKIIKLIENSNLKKEMDSHMEYLNNDYNVLKSLIRDKDKYFHYRLLVGSRVFSYSKNGKQCSGMVPYADMLNHSDDSNCTWYYNDSTNSFEVKATKDIEKGGEIFDSYGLKTNVQYYLYYGFTLDTGYFPISIDLYGNSIDLTTDLNNLLERTGKDRKDLLKLLGKKLKSLPTKNTLKKEGANEHIIKLLGEEKDILKRLIGMLI